MRKAITISVLFHVALLTWALGYFTMSDTSRKPVKQASVPVDIMTPSQFSKIKAGKKDAAKTSGAAPKAKRKKAEKKTKPKPKKTAKPKPKPKPKPEPKKNVGKKNGEKPKKIARPKPKPKPKPRPKKIARPEPVKKTPVKPRPAPRPKSDFDPDNIAALLNKLPDRKSAPRTAPLAPVSAVRNRALTAPPSRGREYGRDETMSANEIDAFKAQVSQCWRPPTGGLGARDINVKLRIRFKPDGTLEKPPELANFSGSPFFRPAAEAAQRAVWQCQPYRMPKEKYATWRDMILNFDPREMFGG